MKQVDLTGKRFSRLVAISPIHRIDPAGRPQWLWICRCDCGGTATVRTGALANGNTRSCGCLALEVRTKHGGSSTPEFKIWTAMLQRCLNPKSDVYRRYGGRGITVCKRWFKFENFIKDMGWRPTPDLSLERRNNNSHYTPANCYWATREQQENNKRTTRRLRFNGRTQSIAQWGREVGLHRSVIGTRLRLGWTVQESLTTALRRNLGARNK